MAKSLFVGNGLAVSVIICTFARNLNSYEDMCSYSSLSIPTIWRGCAENKRNSQILEITRA